MKEPTKILLLASIGLIIAFTMSVLMVYAGYTHRSVFEVVRTRGK